MIALVGLALAGPWTRELGSTYVKAGADYYVTSRYVLPAELPGAGGGTFATTSFFGQQYGVYAEAGVSDRWPIQLAGRVPMALSTTTFSDETTLRTLSGTAFSARGGDLELSPQIALSRKRPIAAMLTVKVPLYAVDGICAESVYRDYCGRPGDGQTDFTGWLLAGGSLARGRAWVEGQVGYRHRTETFRGWNTERELVDSAVFAAALGANAGPVIGIVRIDGNKNLVADPWTMEAVRVGPAAMITVWRGFALEARGAWDVWARNSSIGVGFGLGVSWRDPV